MLNNYFKIAFRVLLRRKVFTFISLFGISFTLVVLIVVSAMFDQIFAPKAPEVNMSRCLGIYSAQIKGPNSTMSGSPGYGLLDRYARNLPNVERMSIFTNTNSFTSYLRGQKIVSDLKRTDSEYWRILQFNFLEGGPITEDDVKNVNFVAVINKATKEKFFGNESAIGKSITADNQIFRIIGVVENVSITRLVPYADVWVPLSTTKNSDYRTELMDNCIALLQAKSSSDFPAIKEEFAHRLQNAEIPANLIKNYQEITSFADTTLEMITRETTRERTPAASSTKLIIKIVVIMILFMLLPTINLININISRILERASEIGVRKAFGATSTTLVFQFITENLILTLIGGMAGFVGASVILAVINYSGILLYSDLQINYRVFIAGLIITIFFGLFSGIYPAWRMSRLNPVEALKGRA